MPAQISRRDALGLMMTASALAARPALPLAQPPPSVVASAVARNDGDVQRLLESQVTTATSPFRGSVPDAFGLHPAGSASSVVEAMAASFVHPDSRFRHDPVLLERITLAAGFLERAQSPEGNVDLLTTNFNSPPDTGFVVHGVAAAAAIGRMHGAEAITRALQPFLIRAGAGMAAGGVHTPNHRWVIGSALAQINDLFPDPRLVRRIDQWLAEGIDIDSDGQFTERSTLTYNVVTNRALVVMAIKLRRPELLEPVRRNLDALTYLLHADGEVVTEISRRQDQYTRGNLAGYWFPVTWVAVTDQNRRFAAMARQAAEGARLPALLEYPELSSQLPAADGLPDDFEKRFPQLGIVRVRRGPISATVILGGSSRLMTLRSGSAVLEGVRFATSFFGKGQFIPDRAEPRGAGYTLHQALEAPYYQPLGRPVTTDEWAATRSERQHSEVARLEQSAAIVETGGGFDLRVVSAGTRGVPLSIELGFREGGTLEGCTALPDSPGSYVLERGDGIYRFDGREIRFGPGAAPHRYVQVRGAEPRLPGVSVYVTGFTPFDHTIRLECR
jgi:hypothetical protein